jgi:hypothetical protein
MVDDPELEYRLLAKYAMGLRHSGWHYTLVPTFPEFLMDQAAKRQREAYWK